MLHLHRWSNWYPVLTHGNRPVLIKICKSCGFMESASHPLSDIQDSDIKELHDCYFKTIKFIKYKKQDIIKVIYKFTKNIEISEKIVTELKKVNAIITQEDK